MVEITRSFSTLELVAKNPSMMTKVAAFDDEIAKKIDVGSEEEKTNRARRDVDSPISPLPTGSSGNQHQFLGPDFLVASWDHWVHHFHFVHCTFLEDDVVLMSVKMSKKSFLPEVTVYICRIEK